MRWYVINIEKLIESLGKALGKLIFNKQEKSSEKFNIEQMTSTDLFKIFFNKLFHSSDYNKAEDLIFKELEENNSQEIYDISLEFYNSLLQKSDLDLNNNNFSREEIYQGLNDLKKYK